MRKGGLANLTMTGHAERPRMRKKQLLNVLTIFSGWMLEQKYRKTVIKSIKILKKKKRKILRIRIYKYKNTQSPNF